LALSKVRLGFLRLRIWFSRPLFDEVQTILRAAGKAFASFPLLNYSKYSVVDQIAIYTLLKREHCEGSRGSLGETPCA